MKKAEVDSGKRAGVPTEVADKVTALEREVRELRQANEILRKASASADYIKMHRHGDKLPSRSDPHAHSPHEGQWRQGPEVHAQVYAATVVRSDRAGPRREQFAPDPEVAARRRDGAFPGTARPVRASATSPC